MKTKKYDWNPANLQYVVEQSGMSWLKICEACDITPKSLSDYLAGNNYPQTSNLLKMADVFAVPLDYLVGRCTKEECDAIQESYADNFRLLRKKDYECVILKFGRQYQNPTGYTPPYPYNLLDTIFNEPFDHEITDNELNGLNYILSKLSDRDRRVIQLRFEEEKTLEEAGRIIHVTRERVRQLEARAIRKMRHPSMSNYIRYGMEGVTRKKELDLRETELNEREQEIKRREEELLSRGIELNDREEELSTKFDKLLKMPAYDEAVTKPGSRYFSPSQAFYDLDLSVRSYNCLVRASVVTIHDIIERLRDGSIIKIRNLGRKSIDEIIEKIKKLTGMTFEEIMGEQEVAV